MLWNSEETKSWDKILFTSLRLFSYPLHWHAENWTRAAKQSDFSSVNSKNSRIAAKGERNKVSSFEVSNLTN